VALSVLGPTSVKAAPIHDDGHTIVVTSAVRRSGDRSIGTLSPVYLDRVRSKDRFFGLPKGIEQSPLARVEPLPITPIGHGTLEFKPRLGGWLGTKIVGPDLHLKLVAWKKLDVVLHNEDWKPGERQQAKIVVLRTIHQLGQTIRSGDERLASDALHQIKNFDWSDLGFFGTEFYSAAVDELKQTVDSPTSSVARKAAAIEVLGRLAKQAPSRDYFFPALQVLYDVARGTRNPLAPVTVEQQLAYRRLQQVSIDHDTERDLDPRYWARKRLFSDIKQGMSAQNMLEDRQRIQNFANLFGLSVGEAVHLIIDAAPRAYGPQHASLPAWADPFR
jgi:hypothetical protein